MLLSYINYAFLISTIFIIILFFLYYLNKIFSSRTIFLVTLLFSIVVSSIRYNVGSDYQFYYNLSKNISVYYNNINQIIKVNNECLTYIIFYIIKKYITFEFAFLWGISLIIYPITLYFYKKESKYYWMTFSIYLLLGFYSISFNILKQSLAMAFLFIVREYYFKKKYILFFIFSLLSIYAHSSSIFAIILLVISFKIKPSMKLLVYSICIGLVGIFSYKWVLRYLMNLLPFLQEYSVYIDSSFSTEKALRPISIFAYVIYFIIFSYALLKKKKYINYTKKEEQIISMIIMCIPISIISIYNWPINRISLYGYQFSPIILPYLFTTKRSKTSDLYNLKETTFMIVALFVWFVLFSLASGNNGYHTYQTYL